MRRYSHGSWLSYIIALNLPVKTACRRSNAAMRHLRYTTCMRQMLDRYRSSGRGNDRSRFRRANGHGNCKKALASRWRQAHRFWGIADGNKASTRIQRGPKLKSHATTLHQLRSRIVGSSFAIDPTESLSNSEPRASEASGLMWPTEFI